MRVVYDARGAFGAGGDGALAAAARAGVGRRPGGRDRRADPGRTPRQGAADRAAARRGAVRRGGPGGAREPGADAVGRVGSVRGDRGDDRAGRSDVRRAARRARLLPRLAGGRATSAAAGWSSARSDEDARDRSAHLRGDQRLRLDPEHGNAGPTVAGAARHDRQHPPDHVEHLDDDTAAASEAEVEADKPKPNPGSLPQTDQLPSAGTAAFHAEMAALWDGVRKNSLAAALPAFFPEAAYTQLKRIGDPSGDYTGRLLVDYQLDLDGSPRAARRRLGQRTPGRGRGPCRLRPLGRSGRLLQRRRLLRGAQLAGGVPRARRAALVRDRVDDLVARSLVRGAPGGRAPLGSDRRRRRSQRGDRRVAGVIHLLTERAATRCARRAIRRSRRARAPARAR